MGAKHYENPRILSRVTAKNVGDGDVFFETHCILHYQQHRIYVFLSHCQSAEYDLLKVYSQVL